MSKFVRNRTLVIDFQGDTVTFEVVALKRHHLTVLGPVVTRFQKVMDDDGKVTMNTDEALELMETIVPVLRETVVSMSGLKDDNKQEVDLTTMFEHAFFLPLQSQLSTDMMAHAGLGGDGTEEGQAQLESALKN